MAVEHDEDEYQFAISLSVLNHLGRNLYRNFVTVLGEAISNSWDADAEQVWVDIYRDKGMFIVSDDGKGMTPDDFQNRFLKIGYSKRKEGGTKSPSGRPYIGAKGIGKLALLSCAKRISVFTKTENAEFTGGVIDNEGLDKAITDDLVPEDYPLEALDFGLIDGLFASFKKGTIIVFEGADELLKNTDEQIRKVLALSFRFSLIDDFTIHVNDKEIGVDDLNALAEATQFLWTINGFEDEFTKSLGNLLEPPQALETELGIRGFIASVRMPRHLKIRGMDERATVDLFTNGRLRERNVIRHVPTQRIVESYIYGQLHFDELDREDADPFTSSREGVVEDDDRFRDFLNYLRNNLLVKVIDNWDKLRLKHRKKGDEENKRRSKKDRRAADFVEAAEDEFRGADSDDDGERVDGLVDSWLSELRPDAQFNVSAYIDCFLSENLLRRYIRLKNPELVKGVKDEIELWQKNENENKEAANLNFDLRQAGDELDFLGMDALAVTAEGEGAKGKQQSLWKDAISYKPVRNAVGHTGVLTDVAKSHLSVTFENIKARIKKFLNDL